MLSDVVIKELSIEFVIPINATIPEFDTPTTKPTSKTATKTRTNLSSLHQSMVSPPAIWSRMTAITTVHCTAG